MQTAKKIAFGNNFGAIFSGWKTSSMLFQIPYHKLLLFVGLAWVTGFVWGQAFAPEVIQKDVVQHYSNPEISIGQYDQMVSVDVIRNNNDIWVVDHYSGQLIFEYNRFKEADKEAFAEYEDLLIEAGTRK